MKLASLKSGRDGQLVVVSRDLSRCAPVPDIAPTMQSALDDWASCEPALQKAAQQLEQGGGEPFDPYDADAALPRCYHWADGSAYVTHVELVRKTRGAELPESFWHDPLMYMGASDAFLGACDDIFVENLDWGVDFESEIAVITDDVPSGTPITLASAHIKLIGLVNDVTLRKLIPAELAKQFGFYQSKPWTSFSPVVVTPDELGDAWDGARVHLPLRSTLNGELIGAPEAGVDATFGFDELIAHAAKTRSLMAGTVVGSGTVANRGSELGSSCLAEVRCLETLEHGAPRTDFMVYGDQIQIEMLNERGESIFGQIDQRVAPYIPPTG